MILFLSQKNNLLKPNSLSVFITTTYMVSSHEFMTV